MMTSYRSSAAGTFLSLFALLGACALVVRSDAASDMAASEPLLGLVGRAVEQRLQCQRSSAHSGRHVSAGLPVGPGRRGPVSRLLRLAHLRLLSRLLHKLPASVWQRECRFVR